MKWSTIFHSNKKYSPNVREILHFMLLQISSMMFLLIFTILLISGYTLLPRRQIYWEQVPDICNFTVSDLITWKRFEEILRYLHIAENENLIQSNKLVNIRPSCKVINQSFFECFLVWLPVACWWANDTIFSKIFNKAVH